jgi:peptidyl-prolyl cis-trans isomerase B (cyclophilin B)
MPLCPQSKANFLPIHLFNSNNYSTMENLPQLSGLATVILVVNGSIIEVQVDGDNAPITAGNFVDLVEKEVYDGVSFHRVVREPQPFVVQGGDPQSKDPNVPQESLGNWRIY